MLLTGSGDELGALIGSGLSSACCWPSFLFSLCLLKVHVEISSLLLQPMVHCSFFPPLLCASFSLLFIVSFVLFFVGRGSSVCPGDYAGLSQRWLGEYCMMLGAYLFGLPNVSQAGLKLATGGGSSPPVFLM
jgi:hypothetical protein